MAGSRVDLSSSFCLAAVLARFLLGTGIRHSMENATQLVHGTLKGINMVQGRRL